MNFDPGFYDQKPKHNTEPGLESNQSTCVILRHGYVGCFNFTKLEI